MLMALVIRTENEEEITALNDGVTPKYRGGRDFFIYDDGNGYNAIITEKEFLDMYRIRIILSIANGRFLVTHEDQVDQ